MLPAGKKPPRDRTNAKFTARILQALQDTPFGMTPTELSKQLHITRTTVTKYVAKLFLEEKLVKHKVGHYTVYAAAKRGGSSLFQTLYYGLIMGLNPLIPKIPPQKYQSAWENLAGQISLPFEEEIPPLRGQPTP